MDDEEKEINHFIKICKVLKDYHSFSSFLFERKLRRIENLSDHQKSLFPTKPDKMRRGYQVATNMNQQCLDAMVHSQVFYPGLELDNDDKSGEEIDRDGFERVEAILHSLVREWSEEGREEREECFGRIMVEVERLVGRGGCWSPGVGWVGFL